METLEYSSQKQWTTIGTLEIKGEDFISIRENNDIDLFIDNIKEWLSNKDKKGFHMGSFNYWNFDVHFKDCLNKCDKEINKNNNKEYYQVKDCVNIDGQHKLKIEWTYEGIGKMETIHLNLYKLEGDKGKINIT